MTMAASYPSRWRAPSIFGSPGRRLAFWALVCAYLVWSLSTLNVDTARMLAGLPRAWTILSRMVPPDFGRWELLLTGMVESVQIAIAATIIGAVLSIPIGIAAAAISRRARSICWRAASSSLAGLSTRSSSRSSS